MIHDIGKIGVSDSILHKPGPLDPIEVPQMQAHVAIGESIVRPLRSTSELLPIIRHHHERFDGLGYPDGLRAREIPRVARIVSVCDAFDALVNDRPYRTRRSTEEALAVLRAGAGTQWDRKRSTCSQVSCRRSSTSGPPRNQPVFCRPAATPLTLS